MDHKLKNKSSNYSSIIRRVTWIGLFVNTLLAIFKLFCGLYGRSQAIVADAIHSFSDTATDIAVIIGTKYWSMPPDKDHPYGHRRIETIITIFIGFALLATGSGIIWDSISSIHDNQTSVTSWIAAIAAFFSIISKEILYQWTARIGREIKSSALLANAWHHRTDALSSIPALIAVLISVIFPKWSFVDHVGAIVVSVFIFHAAIVITIPAIKEILEVGAPEEKIANIKEIVLKEKDVIDAHEIRSRYVASSIIVDMHLIVDGSMTVLQSHEIAEVVRAKILDSLDEVIDVVIHIEPDSEKL